MGEIAGGRSGLRDEIDAFRFGFGRAQNLTEALHEAVLLVPVVDDRILVTELEDVDWICAFTDETEFASYVAVSGQCDVDPQVLLGAAAGINAVVGAREELGIEESASAGRGFANIVLSTMEAGHHGVQQRLEEFTERWTWGVRALVQAANSIARTLDLSAGLYHSIERVNSTTLKTAWTNVLGGPRTGSDEIGSRSWGETFADNPANSVLRSDYSVESFSDAWSAIKGNGEAVANDSVKIALSGAGR